MGFVEEIRAWVRTVPVQTETLFRVGLGATIILAGLHKFVNPVAWTSYMAPLVEQLLASLGLSAELFMMMNAVFEIVFGLVLILGFRTALAAGLVTLSLTGIVVNLLIVNADVFALSNLSLLFTAPGEFFASVVFADILIRDIGLVFLAAGVTLQELREGG